MERRSFIADISALFTAKVVSAAKVLPAFKSVTNPAANRRVLKKTPKTYFVGPPTAFSRAPAPLRCEFSSLSEVEPYLSAGDIVYVMPGIYREPLKPINPFTCRAHNIMRRS